MKTFITSENAAKFAKVQSAASYADRGEIIICWDELDKKQKKQVKHIDIDEVTVYTSDPRSVPDKWSDHVVEQEAEPETVDLVKQIIANPARADVYELLVTHDPPEPLILWWLDKTYSDQEYFRLVADSCLYSLFKGNNRYLWATIAFGVEAGVGSFHWPQSEKDDPKEKKLKQRLVDELGIPKKEVELAFEDVKHLIPQWIDVDEETAEAVGIDATITDEDEDSEEDGDEVSRPGSLLDV